MSYYVLDVLGLVLILCICVIAFLVCFILLKEDNVKEEEDNQEDT